MSRLWCLILGLFLLSNPLGSLAAQTEMGLAEGIDQPYPAPLILGISSWINSEPIKLSDLNGKVVLIEFWASTCPFCQRALPYVNDWYDRYHDKGLMIIGIHSPKSEEERDLDTVRQAVSDFKIHYPVAIDNNFETWDNYGVSYWPAFFLIDKKGQVVYVSFGAENYEIIEYNIEYLLKSN